MADINKVVKSGWLDDSHSENNKCIDKEYFESYSHSFRHYEGGSPLKRVWTDPNPKPCGVCGVDYHQGVDGNFGFCRYCEPDIDDSPFS